MPRYGPSTGTGHTRTIWPATATRCLCRVAAFALENSIVLPDVMFGKPLKRVRVIPVPV